MTPGEIHVWRVPLDAAEGPPPTAGEVARAARFHGVDLQRRYLRSHAALREILAGYTDARLDFAVSANGKPFLPGAPDIQFNLSHSREMALVAVTLELEVGVDVEWIRPMPDYREIADRFFPPAEAAQVADEDDFFRRWTRLEAVAKACGTGVYGIAVEPSGEWTIEELAAAPGYAAAVAAPRARMRVTMHDFGVNT
jgi:4'-phosphopantetheinyl transferase